MPKLGKIHPLWKEILLVPCLLSAQVYKVTSLDLGNQSLRTDIDQYLKTGAILQLKIYQYLSLPFMMH